MASAQQKLDAAAADRTSVAAADQAAAQGELDALTALEAAIAEEKAALAAVLGTP